MLSASSEFFKNILKKAGHASPMIYLSGVSTKNLLAVMDYIYQGEVQLYQEDLDSFLNTAQNLKINGLISDGKEEPVKNENSEEDITVEEEICYNDDSEVLSNSVVKSKRETRPAASKVLAVNSSNIDAKAAVDELVERIEEGWRCKSCGKTAKTASDIRRHAEIHIDGLSFDCPVCQESFRSRNSLNRHKHTKHRNI